MKLALILCVALLAAPAAAKWKRVVSGVKADVPPAHALPFFEQDPRARGNGDSLAIKELLDLRRPEGSEPITGKVKAELTEVGRVGSYTVFDMLYTFDAAYSPILRSVLVQAGPRQYREILMQAIPYMGMCQPTEIVHAGTQPLVLAAYWDETMYRFPARDYLVVGRSGAAMLDTSALDKAERAVVLPKGLHTWSPASDFDMAKMLYVIGAGRESDDSVAGACCVGRIEIPFRIVGHRVIAGAAKYVEDDE